jgi:excisionase family DNA binding protein
MVTSTRPVQVSFLGEVPAQPTTLSTQQAAQLAQVSRRVIQRWAKAGAITAVLGPTGYRVDQQSLTVYLAQRAGRVAPALEAEPLPAGGAGRGPSLALEAFDAAGLR